MRTYMQWYQIVYQKKKQPLPAGYEAYLKKLKIVDEQVFFHYDYNRFLRQYVGTKWSASENVKAKTQFQSAFRRELGEHFGELMEILELSGSADNPNHTNSGKKASYLPKNQYLVDYIMLRSREATKTLKAGDQAPGFALVDENDSLKIWSKNARLIRQSFLARQVDRKIFR